jgi:hypothetical protein
VVLLKFLAQFICSFLFIPLIRTELQGLSDRSIEWFSPFVGYLGLETLLWGFHCKDKDVVNIQTWHLFISWKNTFHCIILNYNKLKLFLMYIKWSSNITAQSFYLFQAFEFKVVLNAWLRSVIRYPVESLVNDLDFRDRKTDTHKGIKGNGQFFAIGTLHSALELAMHKVHNYWLISL